MMQNIFSDGLQNYLVFISINKYRFFGSTNWFLSLKSRRIPEETIKNASTPDSSFIPKRNNDFELPEVKCKLLKTI